MTKHTKEPNAMISQAEADQLFSDAERAQETAAFLSDPDYARDISDQPESPCRAWLRSYSGSFAFLLDMKARLLADKPFTERQVDAIKRCYIRELECQADQADALLDEFYAVQEPAGQPQTPASAPVTEAGFFELEGSIIKVQVAVHGSGNLYAKRLMIDEGAKSGSFVYEPGLISKLRESNRLTPERAAELGKLYGICMICGRTLTDETSIERGIGPICAGRM